MNVKVERTKQTLKNLSDKEIVSYIEKENKAREEYYNYITFKQCGYSNSYILCLDSSKLGIQECVNIIKKVFSH